MALKVLGAGEEPTRALFFVYNGDQVPLEEQSTLGVASLVAVDGIAVTCAHVSLYRECLPGMKMWLVHFGTWVAVEATVLEQGWSGPDLRRARKTFEAGRRIDPSRSTPDDLDRDLAFLSLDLASACRKVDTPGDSEARELLLKDIRVMPLGVPGYKHGSKPRVTAWCAHWINRAADAELSAQPSMAEATIESVEPYPRDTIQVQSDTLAPGFSGSPLWDPDRGIAVGIVRQGIRNLMPGRVLATDARALQRHPAVKIDCDAAARRAIRALGELSSLRCKARHLDAVGVEGSQGWVEPEVQALGYDDRERRLRVPEEPRPRPALEAIFDAVRARGRVLLLGDAGIGKSRLLDEIAGRFARAETRMQAAVPLLLTGTDLLGDGAGLAARVNHAFARSGLLDSPAMPLTDLLSLNGVELLLLVDGIDELAKGARLAIIDDILRAARLGSSLPLACLILASRPIDELEYPDLLAGFAALEVLPFDRSRVEAYVAAEFPLPEERARFSSALKDHRLFESAGNPLQLTFAAVVFRRGGPLTDNPVELVRNFVTLELIRMRAEGTRARESAAGRREPLATPALYPQSQRILDLIALAAIRSAGDLASDAVVGTITAMNRNNAAWLADETHLQLFIDKELSHRSGLIHTDGPVVRWLHRTIAEHCAAEAVVALADSDEELRSWAVQQLWDTARYGFMVSLLGLLHLDGRRSAVESLVRGIVRASTTKPRTMVIPLRLLATGMELSDGLTRDVVRQFVRIMLANELRAKCSELLLMGPVSDIADAERLFHDSRIRPLIVAAIEERLSARKMRRPGRLRTGSSGSTQPDWTIPISSYEEEFLRRFGLRDQIDLPLRVRATAGENPGPGGVATPLEPPTPALQRDERDVVDAGGVAYVFENGPGGQPMPVARMPAREFAESLVDFSRHAGPDVTPGHVVSMYIRLILDRSGRPRSTEE